MQNGELTLDQVKPAYAIIDAFHHKKVPGFDVKGFDNLEVIARDAKQLQEEQDLFDLNISAYLKLQRCGEQLGYLKSCWDWVGGVMYTFTGALFCFLPCMQICTGDRKCLSVCH